MQNTRIFVSGGAGVIGKALVSQLIEKGADVFVGDLRPCPSEWRGKVKYRQGDLNAIAADELIDFNPEIFFHLAATFERTEETYSFLEENFHHNIRLSHHLMKCLKDSTFLKKVVFASSYLVYDPTLYLFENPQEPVPLDERECLSARNICGAAKLFHEAELQFLTYFKKQSTAFISARIFRVYGRSSRDVISRWVRSALRHETLQVYGAQSRFDYVFADDVAEGLIRLSETNFSGPVNLGSGYARSIQEVIDILKLHFPELKVEQKTTNQLIESSQANMKRFKSLTGWRPTHTLEAAIPKLIEFERTQLTQPIVHERSKGVLVTSISKKIPLLKSVRKAIEKIGLGWRLYGCDSNLNCIGQYGVDEFWHCPPLKHLTIENIISYCQLHGITMIIPTRNADLQFFSGHLLRFQHEGIHVMVSSEHTIKVCLDKKLFSDQMKSHSFSVIPTYCNLDEFEAETYVVKEQYGAGSKGLCLQVNKMQASQLAMTLNHPIYQPFIEGLEWSVDVYRSRQGKVMGSVARQRNLVVEGESQITTTASYPALEKLCQELAHQLQIYGHAVFQIIEDEKGFFHIVECNPRFGGASTASIAVGLDSFYWFFLESLGEEIEEYPFFRSKHEVRQVRHPADWVLTWL